MGEDRALAVRLNARIANQRDELAHKEFVIAELHKKASEAAATIERLAAENTQLREQLDAWMRPTLKRTVVEYKRGYGPGDGDSAALNERQRHD